MSERGGRDSTPFLVLALVVGCATAALHPTEKGRGMSDLEWGASTGGWLLSISLDKPKLVVGEKVVVTLVTKNAANRPQKIPTWSRWTTYSFNLRDEQAPIPATMFGRQMEDNRGSGSMGRAELAPGESIVIELPLSRLFDLSLAGRYTVQASRIVEDGAGRQVPLASNFVSFEITEPE